jgi:hypothetical protein
MNKKGRDAMNWEQKQLWSRFASSGKVEDYLQYKLMQRQHSHESEGNPLQRIKDSSRYKSFY